MYFDSDSRIVKNYVLLVKTKEKRVDIPDLFNLREAVNEALEKDNVDLEVLQRTNKNRMGGD